MADRKEQTKKERRRRDNADPMASGRLYVPEEAKDPNFHYHFLNDAPGRIYAKTQQDDYDIVTVEELENNKRLRRGEEEIPVKGEGTPYKVPVGTSESGEWLYAYLAKKPKEFFDEDKAKAQAEIADAEKSLKKGPAATSEGLGQSDHGYVKQAVIE